MPLFVAGTFSGVVTALLASDTTVGATSVKATVKLVLTLLPSALVAVTVTVPLSVSSPNCENVQVPSWLSTRPARLAVIVIVSS